MATVRIDIPLILSAVQLSRARKLSFWDALVIRAATEDGATTLYSEDLQHGQAIGQLTIRNPFIE